jgi:membrane protein
MSEAARSATSPAVRAAAAAVNPAGPSGEPDRLGRRAATPFAIPWRGWRQVIGRTWREISSDRISLVAAGCAFYATLALFPSISMLVSLYGLVFDPSTVEPQLATLQTVLPPEAYTLIDNWVHTLVSRGGATLGVHLLVSTLLALWSSATGTKAMLSALNLAYEEKERRSFIRFQLIGLFMTLCAIVGAILGIATLVFLPVVVTFLGLSSYAKQLLSAGSFLLLLFFVLLSLSLLYRFGPSRTVARWTWVTPGSVVATALWLLVSVLFSYYVGHLASYDATYGPLGAVVGVMMWFWFTAYVVLLGAELNAELEMQTRQDSTRGPAKPMGRRGAFVADHVADGTAQRTDAKAG